MVSGCYSVYCWTSRTAQANRVGEGGGWEASFRKRSAPESGSLGRYGLRCDRLSMYERHNDGELGAVPRSRSERYESKKSRILDTAAAMFAEYGYLRCKMEDIAARCDVSKSMLYHYFARKEDVLFEILQEHVSSLNETMRRYLEETVREKTARDDKVVLFRNFIEIYLDRATKARERHAVTLNDTRWLTPEQLAVQEDLERQNIALIVDVLKAVNSGYGDREYRVYALLLIGMINWLELWYRPAGSMPRQEIYDRISFLFLRGFLAEYPERAP
jgi:AcrR family transcriptional regulator